MLIQYFLNVAWIDIIGARKNQVFFAINDSKEAIFVHTRQVACVQPAIPQGLNGLFGHLPIALHDLRPADQQFADFSGRYDFSRLYINNTRLGARQGDANATYTTLTFEWV